LQAELGFIADLNGADVKQVFQWLERSISTGESRFMIRALRQMGLIRKRLDGPTLQDLLSTYLPAGITDFDLE
jgi:hypothetical protein